MIKVHCFGANIRKYSFVDKDQGQEVLEKVGGNGEKINICELHPTFQNQAECTLVNSSFHADCSSHC